MPYDVLLFSVSSTSFVIFLSILFFYSFFMLLQMNCFPNFMFWMFIVMYKPDLRRKALSSFPLGKMMVILKK